MFAVLVVAGVCQANTTMFRWQTAEDFDRLNLSHARWDSRAGGVVFDGSAPGQELGAIPRAIIESPEIPVPAGYDQAIASWNAFTPPGSYISVYIRGRVGGVWTGWYELGLWNMDQMPVHKTTFRKQKDSLGDVDCETLELIESADAFKIRIQLESSDGCTYPTLRFLSVVVNDSTERQEIAPVKEVWGTELDVPYLCQLSVPGGNVWCSATSTAMVLGYWSEKLRRPELKVGITQVANNVYDEGYRGTGNWSFNVAYAGEFPGIRAYVDRLTSVSQIEQWIAKGVPVIVSVNHSSLRGEYKAGSGHLMVIRGFTENGDPVFNDPWARLEKGENLRKIYTRQQLEDAWLGPKASWGTVYIIHPEGWDDE